jgi:hypothetical protein
LLVGYIIFWFDSGFTLAIPTELAKNLVIDYVLLINNLADIIGKLSTFYTVQSNLGYCGLAFKRLIAGLVVYVDCKTLKLTVSYTGSDHTDFLRLS